MDIIEIPQNLVVRCPLVEYQFRRARLCEQCEYCAGLTERVPATMPAAFHVRFALRCSYPTDRGLCRVTED